MSRRKVAHPVRELSAEEQAELKQLSRSSATPAAWVERAKALECPVHAHPFPIDTHKLVEAFQLDRPCRHPFLITLMGG